MEMVLEVQAQGQTYTVTTKAVAATQQHILTSLNNLIKQNHAKTINKLDSISKKGDDDDKALIHVLSTHSLSIIEEDTL